MSDGTFFDGKKFIAAIEAAQTINVTRDYIARLCRNAELDGRRIGKLWFVSEESLHAYILKTQFERERRTRDLAKQRTVEYAYAKNDLRANLPLARVPRNSEQFARYSTGAVSVRQQKNSTQTDISPPALAVQKYAMSALGHIAHARKSPLTFSAMVQVAPDSITHTFVDIAHRLLALIGVFIFVFSAYALVDDSYAAFASRVLVEIKTAALETPAHVVRAFDLEHASYATAQIAAIAETGLAEVVGGNVFEYLGTYSRHSALSFHRFVGALFRTEPPAHSSEVVAARMFPTAPMNAQSKVAAQKTTVVFEPANPVTVVKQPVIERVIERVVERAALATQSFVTDAILASRLGDLEQRLAARIDARPQLSGGGGSSPVYVQTFGVSQKIDRLDNIAITGGSISGANITGGSVAVSSLSGTLGVGSGGTGTTTFGQGWVYSDGGTHTLAASTSPSVHYLTATSTTIASTFPYASSTALTVSGTGYFGTASTTNLTFVNATGTNATSTTLAVFTSPMAPAYTATSSTATSTFAGGILASRSPTLPHTFSSWSMGASNAQAPNAALVVNPATAVGDSNLISASVGDSVRFLVDAEGDVFVNNLTSVGSVTLSTTSASTFTVEGNTTLGDAITDTTTVNGTLTVTGTTTTASIAGKFGVGTTTPWAKLSVHAGSNEANTMLFAIASSTGSATTTLFTISNTGAITAVDIITSTATRANTFPYASSTAITVSGTSFLTNVLATGSSTVGSGTQAGGVTVFGGATTTGNAYFMGNVGIGTTTPWGLLSVHPNALGSGVPEFVVGSSTATHFVIDGGGNVGIGTTSPGSRFSIQSIANFQSGTSTIYDNLNVQGQLKVGTGSIYLNGAATSTYSTGIQASALNLLTNGALTINGTGVLNATTLGSGVTGSSLTSVGTITSGTWNGTTIAVANGGTGATSLTDLITLGTHTTGNYVASITAGGGLTGTVASEGSAPTLAVGAGTAITVNADDIAVTADAIGDTQLAFNTGQHLTTASSPTFAGLTVNGNLNITGVYQLSGASFAVKSGNYHVLYEPAGNPAMYLGNAADPANYYDNTTHHFRNRGGTANFVDINSTALYAYSQIQSPIFYDYNNTGYYMDPASASNLYSANFAAAVAVTGGVQGAYNGGNGYASTHGFLGAAQTAGYYGVYGRAYTAGYAGGFYDNLGNGCSFAYNTTNWSCSSDARIKKNIQNLASTTDALEAIMALRPVTSSLKGDATDKTHIGFIAQDVQSVFPELVSISNATTSWTPDGTFTLEHVGLIAPTIAALQQLNIKIDDLSATTPSPNSFAARFFGTLKTRLIAWFSDAENGIASFFAKEIHAENVFADTIQAKKLCLDDICISKPELQELLNHRGQMTVVATTPSGQTDSESPSPSVEPDPQPPTQEETATSTPSTDTEPPTITINGNNPAEITVGDTYADLGASVTDNVDANLGIHTFVDGAEVTSIQIDTTTAGSHAIIYRATDTAGNTGEATRAVNVISLNAAAPVSLPIEVSPAGDTGTTTPVTEP